MTSTAKQPDGRAMCAEHFPGGWPGVPAELTHVACEHGRWTRPDPAVVGPDAGQSGASGS